MEILDARVEQRSVFFQRITELFEFSDDFFTLDLFISEVRDQLVEISNKLDHRQMAQLLRSTHLSEFSQTMQSINKKKSQDSSSLH